MSGLSVTAMRSDLTARSSDRQELIRSIKLSPIASIVTDPNAPDNPIIAVNEQFERLTGYTEDELVGRNCRILAGPATEGARLANLREAVANATPAVAELLNYRKDGSTFVNAVMIAPVLGDDGKLAYFVGSQMEVDWKHRILLKELPQRG
jgi:PAS domain S-box-containing protein